MEKSEHKLPFELIVGDETGEIMNGDVPVRWCVTPELVKKLEDDKIVDPHILLVTATDKGLEMQRQTVPITELMTYVRFTKAGAMKLYGFIIDGACGRKKLHSTYMRKVAGDYGTDILYRYTGEPHDHLPLEYTRTEVTVEIPAGVFGEEPGPWMKWFVNLWHTSSGKVVDECHYRRRLMIAFSLKWLPVLIWATMLIVARVALSSVLALAGYFKGMKFWRAFRPFKWCSVDHILDGINDFDDNPFLIKRKYTYKNGYEQTTTMFFTVAFIPLVLVLQTSFVWAFADHFVQSMLIITGIILFIGMGWDIAGLLVKWLENTEVFEKISKAFGNKLTATFEYLDVNNRWRYLKWLGYGVIATIVVIFSSIFITVGLILVPTLVVMILLMVYGDAILTRLNNAYTVAPENNDYTEIRELLCPKDELNLKPDINFIPPKQRTIRLWYLDLKNKVCKPMQS